MLAAGLFIVLFSAMPAWPEPPGFGALARQAEIVALATCTTAESRWDAVDPIIVTRVELQVDRLFKGEAGSTLLVNTLGGRVGQQGMGASDAVSFTAGERAVVFLRSSTYGPYYVIVGGTAGKLGVESSSAGLRLRARRGTAIDLATFAARIAGASAPP